MFQFAQFVPCVNDFLTPPFGSFASHFEFSHILLVVCRTFESVCVCVCGSGAYGVSNTSHSLLCSFWIVLKGLKHHKTTQNSEGCRGKSDAAHPGSEKLQGGAVVPWARLSEDDESRSAGL